MFWAKQLPTFTVVVAITTKHIHVATKTVSRVVLIDYDIDVTFSFNLFHTVRSHSEYSVVAQLYE